MKISKNTQVQQFLDDIMLSDDLKYDILIALRNIVFDQDKHVSEKMMYGGIMFTSKSDFGGIFVSKNHVSFEFGNGYMFDDPDKILEGTGKYRRHLKIKNISDISEKQVSFFVEQSIRLNNA